MLEKFLVLLERFVVAHELIAANSAKQVVVAETATIEPTVVKEVTKEIPVEGEDTVDTKPAEEEKPNASHVKLKQRAQRQSRKKRRKKSIISLCVTRFRLSTMRLTKVRAMLRATIPMNCWKSSPARK